NQPVDMADPVAHLRAAVGIGRPQRRGGPRLGDGLPHPAPLLERPAPVPGQQREGARGGWPHGCPPKSPPPYPGADPSPPRHPPPPRAGPPPRPAKSPRGPPPPIPNRDKALTPRRPPPQ